LVAFKTDPAGFIEKECMEMWGLVGPQYLGQKFYVLGIFDQYKELHPEVGEHDYTAFRNPDGTLVDEAVDIFYKTINPETHYRSMFLQAEKMDQQLSQNEPWSTFGDLELPESLRVDSEDLGTIKELLDDTNAILHAGLDYHTSNWNDTQRFSAIIKASRDIYRGTIDILERNWRNQGVNYSKEDVLKILSDLAPQWLPWRNQVSEPSEVIKKVLTGIDAMTHPIETPDGQQVFGPEQLLYWGPALEVHTS